jgi:hypothetical protein
MGNCPRDTKIVENIIENFGKWANDAMREMLKYENISMYYNDLS